MACLFGRAEQNNRRSCRWWLSKKEDAQHFPTLKPRVLTDTGHARLLLGVALLKQSNLAGAKKAFEKAGTIVGSTHAARQWLAYLAEQNRTTEDHADGG